MPTFDNSNVELALGIGQKNYLKKRRWGAHTHFQFTIARNKTKYRNSWKKYEANLLVCFQTHLHAHQYNDLVRFRVLYIAFKVHIRAFVIAHSCVYWRTVCVLLSCSAWDHDFHKRQANECYILSSQERWWTPDSRKKTFWETLSKFLRVPDVA